MGDTGIEGISLDPVTGGYVFVNETAGAGASQDIVETQIDVAAGTASNGSATAVNNAWLFPAANVGLSSFNDVYAPAKVYGSGSQNLSVLRYTAIIATGLTRHGIGLPGRIAAVPEPGSFALRPVGLCAPGA